jgi:type IV pilus assembly protein PilO
MKLDDLKKLDVQGLANLPWVAKFVAMGILLILLLAAGYWYDWKPALDEIKIAQEKEAELRDTFIAKKKKAINLPIYKQQMADIERTFGVLLRQLPNKAEVDGLLSDISQAGIGRGLEFVLFKPAEKETPSEFYAELPVTIRVVGSFHEIGMFATDVSKLPRIVTLHELAIVPQKDSKQSGGPKLVMDAVAKTYRYLDQNEMGVMAKGNKKDAKKITGGKK